MNRSLPSSNATDLNSQAWTEIARRPLETIKGYMLASYPDDMNFHADAFNGLFKSPEKIGSILDFGCGIGRNFPALRDRCRRLCGYDIPEMIAACVNHCDDHPVELTDDWGTVVGREYDLIVASFAFQHIEPVETLHFYIESLSTVTDYLYVAGRHWRDGPGSDNILKLVMDSGRFELVRCSPAKERVLGVGPGGELHVEALFRTVNKHLHREANEEVLERPAPVRLGFEDYNLVFDLSALADERGIGRVNQQLLVELEKLSASADRTDAGSVPEVNFFGSIHWCPDTLKSPSVVLVHDVIPLKFPDQFPGATVEWRERLSSIVRQADYIATVSRSSARDIELHLGIDGSRIDVVPNGITRLPVPRQCDLLRPRTPYLVYVGSDDPHKNAGFLFELMNHPGLKDYSLAMVGPLESLREHPDQYGLGERVSFYGRLTDSEVGFVLAGSRALVLPSLYEGFGLPPFEAALLGVPSVCSDRPAMNELLDGCVDLADPRDIEAWAAAIAGLEDPEYRRRRIRETRLNALKYTPAVSAAGLARVFRRAANRYSRRDGV